MITPTADLSQARPLTIHQPRLLSFGTGTSGQVAAEFGASGRRRVLVVTSTPIRGLCEPIVSALRERAENVTVWDNIAAEPTVADFRSALAAARSAVVDAVIGIGGGSALDVAKLVAAFAKSAQDIRDAFGIDKLVSRETWLACLPTTAGTGSEVSPNAILLDESEQLKKGVISRHLVPDVAIVDPSLTVTAPPAVTGATGIDALTHCIEAYANKLSHPTVDLFALEGARLIAENLPTAYLEGPNLAARSGVALGSLYGGLCLGPVNTGAVHALSYPLGGEFHVPHGLANAVLLCPVLEFNLPAAPERYAEIAVAIGAARAADALETARAGVELLRRLTQSVGIPPRLRDLGVPQSAIDRLATAAMTVTRLLDRNPRPMTHEDAVAIYRKAF